jgi:hypothetical protein
VSTTTIKEHPILFSGEMVRAVLRGDKTQTRRLAKLTASAHVKEPRGHRRWHPGDPDAVLACPYGAPGDRLWVRETFMPIGDHPDPGIDAIIAGYFYRADYFEFEWADLARESARRWKPSMHMPRHASRIMLEVVSRRLERVQAISGYDAHDEGVEPERWHYEEYDGVDVDPVCDVCGDEHVVDRQEYYCDAINEDPGLMECPACEAAWARRYSGAMRLAFRDLWDSVYDARGYGWVSNPWVWVVEFERITP